MITTLYTDLYADISK